MKSRKLRGRLRLPAIPSIADSSHAARREATASVSPSGTANSPSEAAERRPVTLSSFEVARDDAPEREPIISGPSFLGLNKPSPRRSGFHADRPADGARDHLRSSGNVDYSRRRRRAEARLGQAHFSCGGVGIGGRIWISPLEARRLRLAEGGRKKAGSDAARSRCCPEWRRQRRTRRVCCSCGGEPCGRQLCDHSARAEYRRYSDRKHCGPIANVANILGAIIVGDNLARQSSAK